MIPAELRTLLVEIEAWGKAHDTCEQEHSERMLNLEPDTAHLISLLAQVGRRQKLLEIGTSNGYSTLWLAWSMTRTSGRIVSIDRSEAKRSMAASNLRKAGLEAVVELLVGEADDLIDRLHGPFDLVFFDADRVGAAGQLLRLLPKLTPDALVLADNILSHPEQVAGYLTTLGQLVEFDSTIVPVGKGLSVSYRCVNPARD
jgi:predicted O-methyltransferase YrrM